jgi:hypothetical protein
VEFLAELNDCELFGGILTGGFAGHCDWRLPTFDELQTIIDTSQGTCGGGSGACIDPTFGPTAAGYWSSMTVGPLPVATDRRYAWFVNFDISFPFNLKTTSLYVRAVRSVL